MKKEEVEQKVIKIIRKKIFLEFILSDMITRKSGEIYTIYYIFINQCVYVSLKIYVGVRFKVLPEDRRRKPIMKFKI